MALRRFVPACPKESSGRVSSTGDGGGACETVEGERGRPPPMVNRLLSAVVAEIGERGVGLLVPFVCGLEAMGLVSGDADPAGDAKLFDAWLRDNNDTGLLSGEFDCEGLIAPCARPFAGFGESNRCKGDIDDESRPCARIDSMTSKSPLGSPPFMTVDTPKPARIDLK